MSRFGKILKKLRIERNLSQRELADRARMGQSDISKLERGAIAETTGIVRLAMALNVSPIYLETGDEQYADLPAQPIPTDVPTAGVVSIRRIDLSTSNAVATQTSQIAEQLHVYQDWVSQMLPDVGQPAQLGLLSMADTSMVPTLNAGDLLIIDRNALSMDQDAIYACTLNDTLLVRRLLRDTARGSITVHADNKEHAPLALEASHVDQLQVLGRVRLAWRPWAI